MSLVLRPRVCFDGRLTVAPLLLAVQASEPPICDWSVPGSTITALDGDDESGGGGSATVMYIGMGALVAVLAAGYLYFTQEEVVG